MSYEKAYCIFLALHFFLQKRSKSDSIAPLSQPIFDSGGMSTSLKFCAVQISCSFFVAWSRMSFELSGKIYLHVSTETDPLGARMWSRTPSCSASNACWENEMWWKIPLYRFFLARVSKFAPNSGIIWMPSRASSNIFWTVAALLFPESDWCAGALTRHHNHSR